MDKKGYKSGKEDGYTKIPNQIIEALMRINLSPYEIRIFFLIIRQTLGWNKKEDQISFSQMAKKTGLDRRLAARATKRLVTRKVVIKKDDSYINKYRVNKNFETWKDVIHKDTVVFSDDIPLSNLMTKLSSIEPSTKDNKNTFTKDIYCKTDRQLTELLIRLILENDPKARAGRLTKKIKKSWIDECRKLRELDKRTPEEIEMVILWCQNDDFEKTVVLSMPKLRKRFDELFLKSQRKAKQEYKPSKVGMITNLSRFDKVTNWAVIAHHLYTKGKNGDYVLSFREKARSVFPDIEEQWKKSDKKPETFVRLVNGYDA